MPEPFLFTSLTVTTHVSDTFSWALVYDGSIEPVYGGEPFFNKFQICFVCPGTAKDSNIMPSNAGKKTTSSKKTEMSPD